MNSVLTMKMSMTNYVQQLEQLLNFDLIGLFDPELQP